MIINVLRIFKKLLNGLEKDKEKEERMEVGIRKGTRKECIGIH